MIKILYTDDDPVLRVWLKIVIQNFLPHSVIEEAMDGSTAINKIKETEFELIILDVSMPDTDPFALVSNILTLKPKAKILMFSSNAERVYAQKFLQLGAMGYVRKNATQTEIQKAIESVLKNKKYLSAFLIQSITKDTFNATPENPFGALSDKEFEIAQHILYGESISEICAVLGLNTSILNTYKSTIFEKLNCKNTAEMNLLAKTHNIIKASCA